MSFKQVPQQNENAKQQVRSHPAGNLAVKIIFKYQFIGLDITNKIQDKF